MADGEMHQRDRSNAIGDSRVMRKETGMEMKPVRDTKDFKADRAEAGCL
jgi:hypothetical protein